jgi:ribosome biogenesis GTPase
MKLEDIGFNETLRNYTLDNNLSEFEIGRVIAEHKERYIVKTENNEIEAEITGNLRFTAESREDFPAVGDWVAMINYNDELGIIHKILPRSSVIKRKSVGSFGDIQIIATNIDFAFIVQAIDRDHNVNRLERYLTICYSAKVKPIIVLSKIDLIDETMLAKIVETTKARISDVPVLAISNETKKGYGELTAIIEKARTYCLLGSSGVGKSTLINNLLGKSIMQTGSISQSTNKGKHVTSHRELVILENGGCLIDNPGMREVGIADTGSGLETTFDRIIEFAENCRFSDCTHTHEKGCAVIEAVSDGSIDENTYKNYLKMEKEKEYFESNQMERKKKDKELGKIVKDYNKKYRKNR